MDKEDIARIRALPLEAVLQRLGAARDPKDPAHNWRLGASRITVTDSRFYDHNAAGALHRMRQRSRGRRRGDRSGAIPQGCRISGGVRELGGLDIPSAVPAIAARVSGKGPSSDKRPLPTPAPDRIARASWYLTVARKIPEPLVEEALKSGQLFADARGNVVFWLRDETGREVGYEVRGTYDRPYHSVHGEKGLFITRADASRSVAFVESGIEALSYRALRGTGLVVSTTGSAVEKPAAMGRQLMERGCETVAAATPWPVKMTNVKQIRHAPPFACMCGRSANSARLILPRQCGH